MAPSPTPCPTFIAGRELEGFIPKSAKDFEEFGKLVAAKHLVPHSKSSHYKACGVALYCNRASVGLRRGTARMRHSNGAIPGASETSWRRRPRQRPPCVVAAGGSTAAAPLSVAPPFPAVPGRPVRTHAVSPGPHPPRCLHAPRSLRCQHRAHATPRACPAGWWGRGGGAQGAGAAAAHRRCGRHSVRGTHQRPRPSATLMQAAIKSLLKAALQALPAQEVKDVETCVAGAPLPRFACPLPYTSCSRALPGSAAARAWRCPEHGMRSSSAHPVDNSARPPPWPPAPHSCRDGQLCCCCPLRVLTALRPCHAPLKHRLPPPPRSTPTPTPPLPPHTHTHTRAPLSAAGIRSDRLKEEKAAAAGKKTAKKAALNVGRSGGAAGGAGALPTLCLGGHTRGPPASLDVTHLSPRRPHTWQCACLLWMSTQAGSQQRLRRLHGLLQRCGAALPCSAYPAPSSAQQSVHDTCHAYASPAFRPG